MSKSIYKTQPNEIKNIIQTSKSEKIKIEYFVSKFGKDNIKPILELRRDKKIEFLIENK